MIYQVHITFFPSSTVGRLSTKILLSVAGNAGPQNWRPCKITGTYPHIAYSWPLVPVPLFYLWKFFLCFPDSSPASTPGMCLNVYLYCSRAHSSCDLPSKSFCGHLDPVVLADFWSLYICDRYACLRTQIGPVFAWILPEPAAASVQLHAPFFSYSPLSQFASP